MEPADHVLLEYYLPDWSDDRRHGLDLQLRLAEIPAAWEAGAVLVVGRALQDQVDQLVDFVEVELEEPARGEGRIASGSPQRGGRGGEMVLASPGRRFFGFVVDYLVSAPMFMLLWKLGPGMWPQKVIFYALSVGYWVVPTARWGRSVGKLVVGTRVQRIDGVAPPGWRVAVVRWGLLVILDPVLMQFGDVGALLSFGWTVLVYAPILGSSRQGIHDRIAKTDVVLSRGRGVRV